MTATEAAAMLDPTGRVTRGARVCDVEHAEFLCWIGHRCMLDAGHDGGCIVVPVRYLKSDRERVLMAGDVRAGRAA